MPQPTAAPLGKHYLLFPFTYEAHSERLRTLSTTVKPTGTWAGVQGQAVCPLLLSLPHHLTKCSVCVILIPQPADKQVVSAYFTEEALMPSFQRHLENQGVVPEFRARALSTVPHCHSLKGALCQAISTRYLT